MTPADAESGREDCRRSNLSGMRTVVNAVKTLPLRRTLTTLTGQNYSIRTTKAEGSRGQRKSKKPEIPNHYPELKPRNGELEKRSLECEQR